MKFKLGDFVRFVDERIEGNITRIIDDQTVAVTDQDDFEIPVLISQITWVQGQHPTDRTAENEKDQDVSTENFQQHGIFVAVVSDPRTPSVVHFHLINQSSYQLLATLKTGKGQKYKGEFAGILQAQSSETIYSASLSEVDRWPEFLIQALFYTTGNLEPASALLVHKKFGGKDFAGAKANIALLKTSGWLIQLDEPVPTIDPQKLKESFHNPR